MKDKEEVTNKFKYFFVNVVPNLDLIQDSTEFLNTTDKSQDPIENAITKYENHRCIISVKKRIQKG